MANYELSNLSYKGDTYQIRDNTALHQNAVGSWTPDFANLKVLATYEFNIASTSYYKICERANVTDITDLVDEVLAFESRLPARIYWALPTVLQGYSLL